MAVRAEAEAAREAVFEMFNLCAPRGWQPGIYGVGVCTVGNGEWGIHMLVDEQFDRDLLPANVGGVPVVVRYCGKAERVDGVPF